MKSLKLIIGLGAIIIATGLASCEKDQINSAEVLNVENAATGDSVQVKLKFAELPTAIRTFMNTNYAGFVFVESRKTTSSAGVNIFTIKFLLKYVVHELKIDSSGKLISLSKGGIPQTVLKETDLLADILTYLKTTYSGYKFVSAEKYTRENKTYFEVKIRNSANVVVELKFDSTGKVLVMSSNGNTETTLLATDLLPGITKYLKEKYPNYTFVSAKKIVKNSEISFEIKVKVGTATYEMKFNANGVIVASSDQTFKNTPLTLNTLPAALTEYLKANYPGYVFESAEKSEKAISTGFNVKIKQNNVTFELKFDANGGFLSVSGSNKTAELKILIGNLPTTALTYLRTTYPDFTLILAKKITKNEAVTYVVRIKYDKKEYEVVFDAAGKLISKKKL